jgi:hypothetical protein
MRVLIFGDANVDVTVRWADAEKGLPGLPPVERRLLSSRIDESQKRGTDLEFYLAKCNDVLSGFFNSLSPRVEFGGCGAIKARTMAAFGHELSFYSWVGDDGNGAMILDELSEAGVDTSNILVTGQTCETYNLFDPRRKRLAFSCWAPKLDFQRFAKIAKKEKPDAVFLTGAHRVKQGLGYSQLPGAYVFTGSFAGYTKKELESKYAEDLSKGILVSNDTEIMQLSGARDPISGMKRLGNEIIIMHGPLETAVKRGSEIITADTGDMEMDKVKELTGIGDVWEAVFISLVGDIKAVSSERIEESMVHATEAAVRRMLGKR